MISGFISETLQRGDRRNFFVSAAYVGIAAVLSGVLYSEGFPHYLPPGLLIVSIGAFIAWFIAHRRYHLIHGTGTSSIRSASQGYVELVGTAEFYPDEITGGLAAAPPSVWYSVRISYGEDGSRGSEVLRSNETFLIRDATGVCAVDPDHAEVITTNRRRWQADGAYYDYRFLRPGDQIYILGEFYTTRPTDSGADIAEDTRDILREWKCDRSFLLQHYDANRDGEVDMREWQKATADARKIANQLARESVIAPGFHMMRAPDDGRPFIISNRDPENLAAHYKWWAWLHLAMFVGAIGFGANWIAG
jgi:hypothetical protein